MATLCRHAVIAGVLAGIDWAALTLVIRRTP